jgi:hypothetical protein
MRKKMRKRIPISEWKIAGSKRVRPYSILTPIGARTESEHEPNSERSAILGPLTGEGGPSGRLQPLVSAFV